MLCTDGLWGALNDLQIHRLLSESCTLKEKLHLLSEAVFQRGAEDNFTVLLFEIL